MQSCERVLFCQRRCKTACFVRVLLICKTAIVLIKNGVRFSLRTDFAPLYYFDLTYPHRCIHINLRNSNSNIDEMFVLCSARFCKLRAWW